MRWIINCNQVITRIEDYCDANLATEDRLAVDQHLDGCESCYRTLRAERRWRLMLAEPVSEPDSGFEQRMLQAAHGGGDARRRWTTPVVGAAMAACLVGGLFLGQWLPSDSEPSGAPVVGPVASQDVQTVNLAFDSGKALQNVTLTLELPPHAELASMPGERRISWQVDLEKGENRLALPLRTLFPGEGELVARVQHGDQTKTFRAPIGGAQRDG